MDTRFGAILFVVIVLAAAVGVAAAQSQPKNATPATPKAQPTPMLALQSPLVVQIVNRPSPQNSLPSCDLTQQSSSVIYCPYTLTVHSGDTVAWVNWAKEPHTIIADNGSFQSTVLSPMTANDLNLTGRDQLYFHKFAKAGTYTYSDYLHPEMHGVVIVK